MTNMSAKFDEEAHNSLIYIIFHILCQLLPWPLTSKINGVHPIAIVNMSAKFDEEANNFLVSIVFTSSKHYGHTHTLTDGTTAALLYPLHKILGGNNKHTELQKLAPLIIWS